MAVSIINQGSRTIKVIVKGLVGGSSVTTTSIGNATTGATAKADPVDGDFIGITDSAAGNIWKKVSFINLWRWAMRNLLSWFGWYNARYYGATGAGTGNDGPAIEACINAAILGKGRVYIPAPLVYYRITSTINITPPVLLDINGDPIPDNQQPIFNWFSMEGAGQANSSIRWAGANNGVVFSVKGWKTSRITDVNVVSNSGITGVIHWDIDTVGIYESVSDLIFTNCFNEHLGNDCISYRLGHTSAGLADISDILFIGGRCRASEGATGCIAILNEGPNTLNIQWIGGFGDYLENIYRNLSKAGATYAKGNGAVYFIGTGGSNNKCDFFFSTPQTYTIRDGRYEDGKQFMHIHEGSGAVVANVDSVEIDGYRPADGILFDLDGPAMVNLNGVRIDRGVGQGLYTSEMFKLRSAYGGKGSLNVNNSYMSVPDVFWTTNALWRVNVKNVGTINNGTNIVDAFVPDFPAVSGGGAGSEYQKQLNTIREVITLAEKAKKDNPQYNAVMADPPTLTESGGAPAAGLTNIFYGITGGVLNTTAPFTYLGGRTKIFVGAAIRFPVTTYSNSGSGGNVDGGESANTWRVAFDTDADVVSIGVLTGVGYRFIVNNEYISKSEFTFASGGIQYLTLDFGSSENRTIMVEGYSAGGFTAAAVDLNYKIYKSNLSDKRIIVVGDSFTEGTGATIPAAGMKTYLADYLGVPDLWASGSGGTGYTNSGSGQYNFAGRLTDWTANAPDIVMFMGGINDVDNSGYQAAVQAVIHNTRLALPDAIIMVFGTFAGSTGPGSTIIDKENKQKAAVLAEADPLTVFIPISTDIPAWVTGNGNTGAQNNSGNADIVVGSDGTHSSNYGQKYYGKREADAAVAALRVLEIALS